MVGTKKLHRASTEHAISGLPIECYGCGLMALVLRIRIMQPSNMMMANINQPVDDVGCRLKLDAPPMEAVAMSTLWFIAVWMPCA
jgi:hypothetical protein